MHGDDGLGLGGDGLGDALGIETPGVGQDIDKDRGGAQMDDGRDRGDQVGVGEDDLIAGAATERGQPHVQGAGTAGGGDSVVDAEVGFEGGLEAVDVES